VPLFLYGGRLLLYLRRRPAMPRFSFVPKEGRFFVLFKESASNAAEVALLLKDLLDSWVDVEKKVESIIALEHKGDGVTHEIIALVNRSFITPFDREDIALLAHSLDDIVDFMEAAADAMNLYKIESPTQRAKELADIILQTTQEVQAAVSELSQKVNLKQILARSVEINRLENQADKVYREALAELFRDSRDIPYIIKWREIYEYLETATDRCEDVANVLEGVALKYA
jgi:predicted phosphate transport protein (TIGR00153 family)